jgi:hypothetical protein
MDRNTFLSIVEFLAPYLDTESSRQALIKPIFIGAKNPPDIDWSGKPKEFTALLVEQLQQYGYIEPNKLALVVLLETVKPQTGVDVQNQIDYLINSVIEASFVPYANNSDSQDYIREVVYSTLLPVLQMPKYIYSAPCKFGDTETKEASKAIIYPKNGNMTPFILHEGKIFCFSNLKNTNNPFRNLVANISETKRYETQDWWLDPDYERWFVELLNRALNKLTGRKQLNWDREHKRYYFQPEKAGEIVEITYQPLNQSVSSRQVVWQPITKKTGVTKSYCYHLAVSLKFHRVSTSRWCLSIRPEMHITADGITPYPSEKKGSKITKKKSRTYNYDLLSDIQFWRSYLSEGQPRIIFPFDANQFIQVSTSLMDAEVEWPGMPEEHAKPFKNVQSLETLWSWAEINQLESQSEDDPDYWDVEEDDWDE